MPATNFPEFVSIIAEEAPHAVVLDWYRRLELSIRAYSAARGIEFHNGPAAERIIAADPSLGLEAARAIARLRRVRNTHTHEWKPTTPTEAAAFAYEAFRLIGDVLRANDALLPNVR